MSSLNSQTLIRALRHLADRAELGNLGNLGNLGSLGNLGRSTRLPVALALGSVLILALATGCDDTPANPSQSSPSTPVAFEDRGPFVVGFRQLEAPAIDGKPARAIKVWYPVRDAAGAKEEVSYPIELKPADWRSSAPSVVYGHAVKDAPTNGGAGLSPLIVFSHGYTLNPEWYSDLLEHYASKGFVVMAPEHVETDWMQATAASFDRPRDISRTLDLAEELAAPGGVFSGMIDMSKVAVVGHSYGGFTALAIAGARFDLGPFNERCAALPPDDPKAYLCAPFLGKENEMAALAGLSAPPDGLWPSQGDPRVKAIVPIAGDAYLFNDNGLSSISIPMMAIGGTVDVGTPWEWGSKPSYDHASSQQKSLVAFEGADHMIPIDPCDQMPFIVGLPELYQDAICRDPVWDKAIAHQWIRHFSTAFLLDVLTSDSDAHEALLPDAKHPTGLVYTTTTLR